MNETYMRNLARSIVLNASDLRFFDGFIGRNVRPRGFCALQWSACAPSWFLCYMLINGSVELDGLPIAHPGTLLIRPPAVQGLVEFSPRSEFIELWFRGINSELEHHSAVMNIHGCSHLVLEFETLIRSHRAEPTHTTEHAYRLAALFESAANNNREQGQGLSQAQRQTIETWTRDHIRFDPQPVDLAAMLDLSADWFSRLFRISYGISARSWLNHQRIAAVAQEIQESDQSIAELALDYGFQNASHFARQFRRVLGSSPRDWRK